MSCAAPRRSCLRANALVLGLLLSIAAAPLAFAAEPAAAPDPFALVEDALDTGDFVGQGVIQETVITADFNADDQTDVAMVAKNDERRVLIVLLALEEGGLRRIGVRELDAFPLGEAQLSGKNGVLVIEDLTGGTTAITSTYRYRYDKATDRMRLIGDDVSLYSRTFAHGMTTISTNRLTGKRITTINELAGPDDGEDAALGPDKVTTSTVPTEPHLYLEDAPVPEETLGLGPE
jgi:hypothetical protein